MAVDENGDNPTTAAHFLNVFGLQIEEMNELINDAINQFFIETADIDIPYVLYTFDLESILTNAEYYSISYYVKVNGEVEERIYPSDSLKEFYTSKDVSLIIDEKTWMGFLHQNNKAIEYVRIETHATGDVIHNTYIKEFVPHHIWNGFDEIGLLVGLQRLQNENNESYKARLLKVFSGTRGATKQGVVENLANMLGVSPNEIEANELGDLAFKGTLLDENGHPTNKMVEYANAVNKQIGNTWDEMEWDEAYWKSVTEMYLGLDYLPHIWNVRPRYCPKCNSYAGLQEKTCSKCNANTVGWESIDFQSGIGDGDDLKIKEPEKIDKVQDYEYYIKAHGSINRDTYYYPEHLFTYKIYAKGISSQGTDSVENVNYTILASERHTFTDEVQIIASETYDEEQLVEFDPVSISTQAGDPELEIVPSNRIESPSESGGIKHSFLKVIADFNGDSLTTPILEKINIGWKDSNNNLQDLLIDSFEEGGSLSDGGFPRKKINHRQTAEESGNAVLAKKGINIIINTENKWMGPSDNPATLENCKIINGTLSLA